MCLDFECIQLKIKKKEKLQEIYNSMILETQKVAACSVFI